MKENGDKPLIHILNAGLKRVGGLGGLPKADLYIDARAFPDDQGMRSVRIASAEKANMVNTNAGEAVVGLFAVVDEAMKHIERRRRDEGDPYNRPFTICAFCAYGINRSVAIRELVHEHLERMGYPVRNLGTYTP